MRTNPLVCLTLFVILGCHHDSSKVRRQKAIYFSVSDVPRAELEQEIARTMESQHLPTPGKAIIYILDQAIVMLPRVDAVVDQAAIQARVQLPPKDPLDEAEDRIKMARKVRSLLQAREAIARIEVESDQ